MCRSRICPSYKLLVNVSCYRLEWLRLKSWLVYLVRSGLIAIVGSWLYFNRAALQWLTTSIVDVPLFNGAMLVAGALLLAFLGWRYQGNPSDRETAANLYAQFFDTPILRGEKEPIQRY